jgi:tyrosinase
MSMTRRKFLATAAATTLASTIPSRFARGVTLPKYRRVNMSTTQGQKMLVSYVTAIGKMLKLPPTDSRNWYRNAFIHTLDCPHGNWWFPPWHRGYTGWFERTIRSLSGNPSFALPFWDWTAQPYVPPAFWKGLLNPANPAYIASYDAFYAQFKDPMSAFWKSLSPAQVDQLHKRGYNSMDDVWNEVQGNPMFFPPDQARSLTQANPNFDAVTKQAVAIGTIQAAIAPKTYTGPSSVGFGFGSGIAPYHSDPNAQFAILEGQPHNNVHNCVGGFMGDFLSPVDPIFFMHHCNIDRLWDVWTRKQQKLGLPTLPTGADLPKWQQEPFLFYVDEFGKPVTGKTTAGAYATIDGFDYDYGPGSGDQFVPRTAGLGVAGPLAAKPFIGTVKQGAADSKHPAEMQVAVAAPLLEAASRSDGPELFAHLTVTPPAKTKGARFNVFVNPPAGQAGNLSSPSFAGTVSIFGGHAHGTVEFAVAISPAVRALRAAGTLKTGEPLRVQVLPQRAPAALAAEQLVKSAVARIEVGSF